MSPSPVDPETPDSFAALSIPGPAITATSARFWEAVAQDRFELQRCDDCSTWVFYPRETCPFCWSDALVWTVASGRGIVRSFSEVARAGDPSWVPAVPYHVILVALEEGPTMLTLLVGDGTPTVGDAVVFSPRPIGNHRLPTFGLVSHLPD